MPTIGELKAFLRPETFESLRWQAEYERCAKDFRHLCSTYLRFKAKDAMGLDIGRPTLTLNRPQEWLYERMQDQWRRNKRVRIICGKARQVGVSTFCRAIAFHQTAFHKNRNALLVTHDEPSSLEMFKELDKTWIEDLPQEIRPVMRTDKRDTIEFTKMRTRSLANHAMNQNVGASQMTHVLHYSEATRVTRNADAVWAALNPSLSPARSQPGGGFLQDHSIAIIESTSRFGGEWFKSVAEMAQLGQFDDWEFVFIPWTMLTQYSAPVPPNFELLPDEAQLLRKHSHVTLENMAWRRNMKATYQRNPMDFYSEFPIDWEESWILPKGVDRVFPHEVTEQLRANGPVMAGARHDVERPTDANPKSLTRMVGGPLEVWELPVDGVRYHMGLDLSGGKSAESDWTVGEIVREDDLRQVAEFRLRIDPASTELEDLVYWTAMAYNTAQINIDITGGWGYAILEALRRRGYPALYTERKYESDNDLTSRMGFTYTHRLKAMLVTNGITLASRGEVIIHSGVLLEEMEAFVQIPRPAVAGQSQWPYYGARQGSHDDAVNAWLLALLSARDERGGTIDTRPEPRREYKIWETKPWAAMDIDGVFANDAREAMRDLSRSVWTEM